MSTITPLKHVRTFVLAIFIVGLMMPGVSFNAGLAEFCHWFLKT